MDESLGPYSDLQSFIDWEGGIDCLLRHGVEQKDVPEALWDKWLEMADIWNRFDELAEEVLRIIEDESELEVKVFEALRDEGLR